MLAGPVEATALGNVLVQARAAGELGSLADMRAGDLSYIDPVGAGVDHGVDLLVGYAALPQRGQDVVVDVLVVPVGERRGDHRHGAAVVGDRGRMYQLGHELRRRGLFVAPVDYPAVPEERICFRACVTANHTRADLDEALNILSDVFVPAVPAAMQHA